MNKVAIGLLTLIGGFISLTFVVFFVGLLSAWPVELLWNWLVPVLFKGPTVTIWQAWGLLILCGLLFKSSSGK